MYQHLTQLHFLLQPSKGSTASPQSFTVDNCGGTGTITTSVSTNNGGHGLVQIVGAHLTLRVS